MIRLAGHSESGDNAKHNKREEEKGNETQVQLGMIRFVGHR